MSSKDPVETTTYNHEPDNDLFPDDDLLPVVKPVSAEEHAEPAAVSRMRLSDDDLLPNVKPMPSKTTPRWSYPIAYPTATQYLTLNPCRQRSRQGGYIRSPVWLCKHLIISSWIIYPSRSGNLLLWKIHHNSWLIIICQ